MTDYLELYKRLAKEILKRDGQIGADTAAFVKQFLAQLRAQGWQLSGDAEAALNAHFSAMNTAIKDAIGSAIVVAAGLSLTAESLQSETVLKLAEQAFVQRWPDGLTLSDRLWRWKADTRTGVQQQLQAAIRQGKSVNALLYDMQRAIERGGDRFKIVTHHADDWVKELHESAVGLIHDPNARADWNQVVGEAEERISMLKTTGSRSAAERVLDQIKQAVDKGSEELVDKAVKWWVYDKQLYNLKRIARTEMADAAHNAVIASVEGDETIIGFQWRLSGSHPATDICDYYANIEMGLGKGVFTRDAVPRHKAHPHCMCLLIPRVTPIKQKGSKHYAEFVKNATPEQRQTLLPNWAQSALQAGVPVNELIRPDGLGLVTHKTLKAQSTFEAARHQGGAHHGWYLQQQGLTDAELEKGIKSLQKQIDKHQAWIDNPLLKIPDFKTFHPDRQRNLIERKWPQDIQRHQDLIAILEGILRERNHDRTQ